MNLGEIKNRIAMTADFYDVRGTVTATTDSNVKSFYLRMPAYIDMAQKLIAQSKLIRRSYRIAHSLPFTPSSGDFEEVEHTDSDLTYSLYPAYAYHFCVSGEATVYVEGVYSDLTTDTLATISAYSDGGFTRFKDLISFDDEAGYTSIQLRFSGDKYYRIRDVKLFGVSYSYYTDIPDYSRYIEYDMPADYGRAISVSIRKHTDYTQLEDFRWETPKKLAVSVYESGELKIDYAAIPDTIDSATEDTYELEIQEEAQIALIDYVAAKLIMHEDYALHNLLMQNYTEKMINISDKIGFRQTKVKATYRWS